MNDAIWARNLDWAMVTASDFEGLMVELVRWRDNHPEAAVLGIAYSDGYSYAGGGPTSRTKDYGFKSALITLQRDVEA